MLSYHAKGAKEIEPGWLYAPLKPAGKRALTGCLSIADIEDGFIINKDGSVAIGFEVSLFEEERLDGDGFTTLIHEFAAVCIRLPIKTSLQKLDIYYDGLFDLPIPVDAPFFYRKTLAHHHQRPILLHGCYSFQGI
jgi:hypothetical protein